MSETVPTPADDTGHQTGDKVVAESGQQVDWASVINTNLSPLVSALTNNAQVTGRYVSYLIALIVVSLTGFAIVALCLNHVDTAEKAIIALVSFLGGAAIFNGSNTRQ